jgi:Ca2+-binding RTX toxin-like protein
MATVINTIDEGWYDNANQHFPNNSNTLTGSYTGSTYNSFFAYDLSNLDKLVTSGKFRVQIDNTGISALDSQERISLWGVSTSADALLAGTANAFSDLQSSINYGTFTFAPVAGNTYEITLTPEAIAAINDAEGSRFALGVHFDTAEAGEWMRFGNSKDEALSELVLEVNETPTAVALSGTSVAEHSATGTVVGALSTSDLNSSDTHSYQLLSNGGGRFALSGDGKSIVVADGSSLDFELAPTHEVTVRSTDSYGAFVDQLLTITLSDLAKEVGSALRDLMVGGPGRDTLIGREGNDDLTGGAGKDLLVGGLGRDVMTGGRGADVFDFNQVKETGRTGSTRDVITDFRRDVDHIDLRSIDSKTDQSGNNKFDFIGFNGFSGHSGELRLKDSGPNVIVQGDVNGDGRSDFEILVREIAALNSTDFYL